MSDPCQPLPPPIGWKEEPHPPGKHERRKTTSRKHPRTASASSSSSSTSSSSSSSSGSSSSSSASDSERKRKKAKLAEKKAAKKEARRQRKEQKRREKRTRKEEKRKAKELRKQEKVQKKEEKRAQKCRDAAAVDCGPPIRLMNNKARAPQTKEEWEKRQSYIRKVHDPETGRCRIIKGDGEILEEMVSRDKHKAINKQATNGDGEFFQSRTTGWSMDRV